MSRSRRRERVRVSCRNEVIEVVNTEFGDSDVAVEPRERLQEENGREARGSLGRDHPAPRTPCCRVELG